MYYSYNRFTLRFSGALTIAAFFTLGIIASPHGNNPVVEVILM
jgi:hypothetical protein